MKLNLTYAVKIMTATQIRAQEHVQQLSFKSFSHSHFSKKTEMTFSNIAAESGSLPPLNAAEEVGETVSDAGAKY